MRSFGSGSTTTCGCKVRGIQKKAEGDRKRLSISKRRTKGKAVQSLSLSQSDRSRSIRRGVGRFREAVGQVVAAAAGLVDEAPEVGPRRSSLTSFSSSMSASSAASRPSRSLASLAAARELSLLDPPVESRCRPPCSQAPVLKGVDEFVALVQRDEVVAGEARMLD